jgi:mRNA interferase MazF
MTAYKQGEIVLVPVPFTDLKASKQRPALEVSADWYNRTKKDCVIVAITSTVHPSLERDELLIQGQEATKAGLLYESVIRAGSIFTIRQALVHKTLGRLPGRLFNAVVERVREVIARG